MAIGNIKDKIAVIGMGCVKFGENWDTSAADMMVDAAYEAYEDAGIEPKDIEAAWFGSTQISLGEPMAYNLKFDHIPITRVENLCATGTDAFRNACFGVASGMYDIVMALGCEIREVLRCLPGIDTAVAAGMNVSSPSWVLHFLPCCPSTTDLSNEGGVCHLSTIMPGVLPVF